MDTGQPGGGPTVLRILLGSQLRRLREDKGVSREQAGYVIRASESKISRMELGRVSFKERDVKDLLALYGVTEGDSRQLLALVRQANSPGWWQRYGDVLPHWFHAYVGLEEAATRIRTYEVQFVPGLLQTEEYARAVITRGNADTADEDVERRVRLRMARQQTFARQSPPRLWAVIDEAALRRPIGSAAVMRAQLSSLLDAAKLQHISIQVMPFDAGGHAAEGGAFSLLRFPEPDLPDVVYVEQLTGALYLEKRDDLERYSQVMERLTLEASQPDETTAIINQVLAET